MKVTRRKGQAPWDLHQRASNRHRKMDVAKERMQGRMLRAASGDHDEFLIAFYYQDRF